LDVRTPHFTCASTLRAVPLLSSRYIEIPQANLENINYFSYGKRFDLTSEVLHLSKQ